MTEQEKQPNLKNVPDKIYLQTGLNEYDNDDIDFNELIGVTWCEDRIEKSDIVYIRQDFANQSTPQKELKEIKPKKMGYGELRNLIHLYDKEEITLSRMLELINEYFLTNSN